MSQISFHILDVFAEKTFEGNQLAVVRDGNRFNDTQMQQIAREFNYSETTFIIDHDQTQNTWQVRIFTPTRELPFAGHPTLGTAYIIQQELIGKPTNQITLSLKEGLVPVTFTYLNDKVDELWMKQLPPIFLTTHECSPMADVLGLDTGDIDDRFPIQEVSTGTPFYIVPLLSLNAQNSIRVNREKYDQLIAKTDSKAILTFCLETINPTNQLNVRMFADFYGVPEDPATGSANGCLAGYLVKYRYFDSESIDISVEQGVQMGRPSLLKLRAAEKEGTITVHVGGKVVEFARGHLD